MTAPALRVVRGEPDDAELAAVVAVLAALAAQADPPTPVRRPGAGGGWADRRAGLRRQLHPGPGQWRRALSPH